MSRRRARMFWASALPFIILLVVCMAGCPACGLLAARKGYNIYIWTAAGGMLVSLVVLAFLPFANKEPARPYQAVGAEW